MTDMTSLRSAVVPLFVSVALSTALLACKQEPAPAPKSSAAAHVEPAAAKALVAEGARLVDVRSSAEFGMGHIDGAENVPVDEVEANGLDGAKDRPVVVYCRSGQRSARAATALRAKGFTRVHDLGAMSSWPK